MALALSQSVDEASAAQALREQESIAAAERQSLGPTGSNSKAEAVSYLSVEPGLVRQIPAVDHLSQTQAVGRCLLAARRSMLQQQASSETVKRQG